MAEEHKICIRAIVEGKVQGVWFRASTQETATSLGLTGWVKNMPEGGVELVACGDKQQVDKLQEWLHLGPKGSDVASVTADPIAFEDFEGFSIKY